jgi:hypothetical protein
MKSTATKIITIIIACLFLVFKASAQISIRYDSENQIFAISNTSLPPFLNSSMPPHVMATYIAADTLCKTFEAQQIDSIADGLADDDIATAFNAIIAAQHYNPLLFQCALFKTTFTRINGYVSSYRSLHKAIEHNYNERIRPRNTYDSIRAESTGGIYLVKVRYQDHRVDSTDLQPSFLPYIDRYYAELELLTPIFGASSMFTCTGGDETGSSYPCLKTAWTRYPREYEPRVVSESDYFDVGPGLLIPESEYIVFLRTWATQISEVGSINFEIFPKKALTVSGGVVYDPENYCGLGTEVAVEHFINSLHAKILGEE